MLDKKISDTSKINKYRVFDFFSCLLLFYAVISELRSGHYFQSFIFLWFGFQLFFYGSQALYANKSSGVKISKTLKIVFWGSVTSIIAAFMVLYFIPEDAKPYSAPLLIFAVLMTVGLVGQLVSLLLWYRSYRSSDEYKQTIEKIKCQNGKSGLSRYF